MNAIPRSLPPIQNQFHDVFSSHQYHNACDMHVFILENGSSVSPAAEAPILRRVFPDDGNGGRHRVSQGYLALPPRFDHDALHLKTAKENRNVKNA